MPKVIDFGVARAIQRDATGREQFTMEGMLIGTPEYMSPEQAAGMLDLDTRTDVYALGVMLYELLTGSAPFESRSLRAAGHAEIQRIIRDVEPPRPSARFSELGAQAAEVAKRRRTQIVSLERELRRELEWIPLKAMRKERERRYATAQEMAADIRRYLEGQALAAGPESRVYRARKFVARNRVSVGASAMVIAAIIAAAEISVRFGLSEREARRRAAYEAETTKAVNGYLVDGVLTASDPDEDGPGVTVETVLERAADALNAKLGPRPEVEMRVASTLGRALVRIGRPERGSEVLTRARGLATGAAAGTPGVGDVLADIDEYLGEALYRQAQGAEAVRVLRERLAALGTGPNVDPDRRATLLNQLGGALKWSQPPDFDGAENVYKEALTLRLAKYGPSALDVLITRHNLAMLELRRGQHIPTDQVDARRAKFNEVFEQVEDVLKDTKAAFGWDHWWTLAVRAEEARLLNLVGRTQDSERAYVETIQAMRRVLSVRHWRTLETLGNYSLVLHALGKSEEEARVLAEATEGYRWLHGPTSAGTQTCAEWLAAALERIGCGECGARELERLHADLASAGEPAPRRQKVAEEIAGIYDRLGNAELGAKWRATSREK
jgi:eukaryotic-like serine/threonine-protein kinase